MACHRLGLFRPGQSQRKNRPLSTPVARPSLTTSSQSAHVCVFASPSAAAGNPLVRRAHAAGLRSPDRGVAARSLGPKGFFGHVHHECHLSLDNLHCASVPALSFQFSETSESEKFSSLPPG